MTTVQGKLKEIKQASYLMILLVILTLIWQSYILYQKQISGIHIEDYIYKKIISNVLPGTRTNVEKQDNDFLNTIIYTMTHVDMNSYQCLLGNNIPLFKYGMLLPNSDENVDWLKLKVSQSKDKPIANQDYFDQSEELSIVFIEDELAIDRIVTKEQLEDKNYVLKKLINFEGNLNHKSQAINEINAVQLVEKKFSINHKLEGPKVLIFHTHSMEKFADEGPGSKGVVDLGNYLKQILETQYGIPTMHCTNSFDIVNNGVDRNGSYERMEPVIEQIIKDNPTIQLVIDLHRDGLNSDKKLLTTINGKPTAKLMFVNGLTKVQKNGVLTPVKHLVNPYVEDNIALALQLQLRGNEIYPGLMRKIYIKPYRYSLHMRPMSLLVEVGAETNTKQEAMNAMEPLGEIIMDVLEKD